MALRTPPKPQPLPDLPPELQLRPHFTRPLQWWNPVDALRLLYWAFFKPQFIREYVKYLAPEAGMARGRQGWILLRKNAALRAFVLYALVLEIITTLGLSTILSHLGMPVSWLGIAVGVAAGCVALGVAGDVVIGVAGWVALGVAFGVLGGVVGGARGLVGGVAGGVIGVVEGMALSVAFGVLFFGMGGVAVDVLFGMALGVVGGMIFGVTLGVMEGVAVGVAVGVTISRALLYPLTAWLGARAGFFDGLAWLPFPGQRQRVRQTWQQDVPLGAKLSAEILDYSLQFIPVIQATNDFLENTPGAAHSFARLTLQASQPDLVVYVSRSLRADMWKIFKRGLLVIPTRWRQTPPYREDTPAQAICGTYARVLYAEKYEDVVSSLELAAKIFEAYPDIQHAQESAWEYRLLADFLLALQNNALFNLAGLAEQSAPVAVEKALRPEVVYALEQLIEVAKEARLVQNATAEIERLSAVARASDLLRNLREYVGETCFEPEKSILLAIIDPAAKEFVLRGGKLGRRAVIDVIPNNYVVGPPVRAEKGQPFVGRQAEYEQIVRFWSNETLKQPILLWGQRRIGKTSILLNLQRNLDEKYLPVYVTLETAGAASTLSGLFYHLGRTITNEMNARGLAVAAPTLDSFKTEPFAQFDAFLDALTPAIPPGRWLVLLLDEFEKIEEKVAAGTFPKDLISYLRGLMQERPALGIILSGSHRLEEMRQEFWNPFMGSTQVIHVGYLADEEAERLLTNPWLDFPLNYEPEAVAHVIKECGGQPMLIQSVGGQVLEIINARLRLQPQEAPLATKNDVEHALAQVLKSNANDYFPALVNSLTPRARAMLYEIAQGQTGLRRYVTLPKSFSEKVVDELRLRDLVESVPGHGLRIRVELLRKWLRRKTAD